jgi:hypothetical protein
MAGNRSCYKRAWLVAEFAARLHFNFVEEPADKEYEWLGKFQSLNALRDYRASNLVQGEFEGFEVTVLDLYAQQFTAAAKLAPRQTVFVVRDGLDGVADFTLCKRRKMFAFSRRPSPPGGAAFDRGEFNERFDLTAPDLEAAISCLNDEVAALCQSADDGTVEVRSGSLMVVGPGTLTGPERYPDLLAHTTELARALLEASGAS